MIYNTAMRDAFLQLGVRVTQKPKLSRFEQQAAESVLNAANKNAGMIRISDTTKGAFTAADHKRFNTH